MFKRHRNAILRILVISIAVITTGISQFSCRTGSDNAATKDHLRPSERLIDTQWVTETQSMAEEVKASAFNLVGAAGTATSDRAVGYIDQVHTLFVALKEQLQILELMRSRRLRIEEGIVVNLNDQTTRGGTVFGVNSVMEVMASMEANLGRLRSLTGSLVDGSNAERGRAISEVSSLAGQLDGLADKLVAQINTWSDQPGGGGGGGGDGGSGGENWPNQELLTTWGGSLVYSIRDNVALSQGFYSRLKIFKHPVRSRDEQSEAIKTLDDVNQLHRYAFVSNDGKVIAWRSHGRSANHHLHFCYAPEYVCDDAGQLWGGDQSFYLRDAHIAESKACFAKGPLNTRIAIISHWRHEVPRSQTEIEISLETPANFTLLSFMNGCRHLVAVSSRRPGIVVVYDAQSGRQEFTKDFNEDIAFKNDRGQPLVYLKSSRTWVKWNPGQQRDVERIPGQYGANIALSPDGTRILETESRAVSIYNAGTGTLMKKYEYNEDLENSKFSKNGKYIYTVGGRDGRKILIFGAPRPPGR